MKTHMEPNIVILQSGFVYVGLVSSDDKFVTVTNAKNLRKWGTENGLAELRNGPLKQTVADEAGIVVAPWHAVIHFIKAPGWAKILGGGK